MTPSEWLSLTTEEELRLGPPQMGSLSKYLGPSRDQRPNNVNPLALDFPGELGTHPFPGQEHTPMEPSEERLPLETVTS